MKASGSPQLSRQPDALSRSCLTKLLLRLPGAPTVVLEGAAIEVWGICHIPRRATEIAGLLADRHGTDQAEVLAHLEDLIEDLVALGVLRSSHGTEDRSSSR